MPKSQRSRRAARSGSMIHAVCRVCGSRQLTTYLRLGRTPLANSYLPPRGGSRLEFREELALQLCRECGLSQLTRVVNRDRLFRNYLYVSSTPRTFRNHCAELSISASRLAKATSGDLVLDIGSNDGCLLPYFKKKRMRILGIDPAKNLAAEANGKRIPTLNAYWSRRLARDVLKRFGSPRIITSLNVLGHVDDAQEFTAAVSECLLPGGIWVVEAPYVVDLIKRNEFDTIYHEHLSYWGVTPMVRLLERFDLALFDVRYFRDLHGGTLRLLIGFRGRFAVRPNVRAFLSKERRFGIRRPAAYRAFSRRVLATRKGLTKLVRSLKASGRTLWAYGASAKGNTLMNYCGLTDREIPIVIDDNPKKWGYLAPGSHMRIVGIQELARSRVDYLLLLSWNFKDEILARCRAAGYRGRFIMPVPRIRILGSPSC